MQIVYDNLPTERTCAHCTQRARWWISKTNLRRRTRNLCDTHFAQSLRKDAQLSKFVIDATVVSRVEVME